MVFSAHMVSFDQLYLNLSYTFRLPNKKSSFCNVAYLSQLYAGNAYAPKLRDITEKFCARPPLKAYLVSEINRKLAPSGRTIGNTLKHVPDRPFLLVCLSTLKPDHEIFHRAYIPPPRRPRAERPLPVPFEDVNNLFADFEVTQRLHGKKANVRTYHKFAALVQASMPVREQGHACLQPAFVHVDEEEEEEEGSSGDDEVKYPEIDGAGPP